MVEVPVSRSTVLVFLFSGGDTGGGVVSSKLAAIQIHQAKSRPSNGDYQGSRAPSMEVHTRGSSSTFDARDAMAAWSIMRKARWRWLPRYIIWAFEYVETYPKYTNSSIPIRISVSVKWIHHAVQQETRRRPHLPWCRQHHHQPVVLLGPSMPVTTQSMSTKRR